MSLTPEPTPGVRLITVIGTGRYSQITYDFRGHVERDGLPDHAIKSHLFPLALLRYLLAREIEIRDLLICCTTESGAAGAAGGPSYVDELKHFCADRNIPVRCVSILTPANEDDLWSTFTTISSEIKKGDEVIFDITHGYRPLFLVLLLSAYFAGVVRGAKVRGLYYGAFEARAEPEIAPVWNLYPLLKLLEWTAATATFRETGHAEKLKQLLDGIQDDAWRAAPSFAPQKLKPLGSGLSRLSRALLLARPREAIEAAGRLQQNLSSAAEEIESCARPFSLLAPLIQDDLKSFAAPPNADGATFLRAHGALVLRAADRGDSLQATILAREWLVSYACLKRGDELNDWQARAQVEIALGAGGHGARPEPTPAPEDPPEQEAWLSGLQTHYRTIAGLRNDLAHAGMRAKPNSAKSLDKTMSGLAEAIRGLMKQVE